MSTINNTLKGYIHSYESFGTVDGPGIRFVVFFQGCMMRCLYCHNADTWQLNTGKEVTVAELMQEIVSYKHFIMPNGGGVTASGGEAILQAPFVKEWFKACHAEGISTCLDTNGYVKHYSETIDELIEVTDLVMLDLKQQKEDIHKKLTGISNQYAKRFAQYLAEHNKRTWIRYVIVPNWTDDDESAHLLGQFTQDMANIEKIELLPYHNIGAYKWQALGKEYALTDIEPPSKSTLERLKNILEQYGHTVCY